MQNYVGKQIDRYRIIERLGMGGMAVVYKAYDTRLEREVALKLIRTGEIPESQHERLFKRFEREAKAQAKFSHRNIIPVYDYGEVDGSPYLVMALVPGGTLKERINGPIGWQQAVRWLIPISEALSYAHQRGFIHRDVKPANILFDDEDQPILTDFGIAKVLETDEATLTGTGLGVGTPEYMAPEQWRGQTNEATDQYALGVVLYELVTGRKPYSADTPAAIILMQANEPLQAPSSLVQEIPYTVEKLLYKALAHNPKDRYESMDAFAKALRSLLTNVETVKPAQPKQTAQSVKPSPKVAAAADSEDVTHDAIETIQNNLPVDNNIKSRITFKGLPGWIRWSILCLILIIIGSIIILNSQFWNPTAQIDDASLLYTTPSLVMITETPYANQEETSTNPQLDLPTTIISYYDDFNNPEFDGDFNHSIWNFWHPVTEGVTQGDGYLKMIGNQFISIIASQHTEAQIIQSYFYESRIRLDPDSKFGSATIKLHIDLESENYWTTQCGLLASNIAFCEMGTRESQSVIFENSTRIDPDNWYTFRIEVDPISGVIAYFIDGESFGSTSIPVKENGLFNLIIGIGPGSTSDTTTAYFDDVNFGPIE